MVESAADIKPSTLREPASQRARPAKTSLAEAKAPADAISLRGEAAELYLRWQRDSKLQGFHLAARVLDFPGGKPGDVGLFLTSG